MKKGTSAPAQGASQYSAPRDFTTAGDPVRAFAAATLRLPVVAAMNAGSLAPVAQAMRASHPGLSLTVDADDQRGTATLARHHSRASIPRAATC